MDNTILELLLIIKKQQEEIRKLKAAIDGVNAYIAEYEEMLKDDKK